MFVSLLFIDALLLTYTRKLSNAANGQITFSRIDNVSKLYIYANFISHRFFVLKRPKTKNKHTNKLKTEMANLFY